MRSRWNAFTRNTGWELLTLFGVVLLVTLGVASRSETLLMTGLAVATIATPVVLLSVVIRIVARIFRPMVIVVPERAGRTDRAA